MPGTKSRSSVVADRSFLGVMALLFAASATVTVLWCASMPSMEGMSMAWMRMPGQSWPGAAATFLGMWTVMMVAMMLPALVPMLLRYRRAVNTRDAQLNGLTAFVAAGYFVVWMLCGAAAYPLGVIVMALTMQSSTFANWVPLATGVVVMLAGASQFSNWKARQLACCRGVHQRGNRVAGLVRYVLP